MSYTQLPGNRVAIQKDPQASLVYGIDVQSVLTAGDNIVSTSAEASGVDIGASTHSGTVIMCRVSGGTRGAMASVTFTWTTASGDTDQRTIWFQITER